MRLAQLPELGAGRGALVILTIEVFIIMLGLGLVTPILPLYAQSFGVGATATGALITIFGFARTLFNIPAGHWTERFGRRRLLVLGPLATTVGSFGFALAGSFEQLLLWRVLQGFGSAVLTTAAMVALADLSTPDNRGRIMSLYQGSLLLGSAAGPALGGFLAEAWGFRAPFLIFGTMTLLAALWAMLRIPETRGILTPTAPGAVPAEAPIAPATVPTGTIPTEAPIAPATVPTGTIPTEAPIAPATVPTPAAPGAIRALLSDRSFLLASILTLMMFFTRTGGQMTILPLLGHNRLGLSEAAIGSVFTLIAIVNFATLYAAGSLSDRFGRKAVIVPSGIITALAIGLYALTGNTIGFVACSILLGIGSGLGGPAPAAYVADIVPARFLGPGMGLYRTISDLGFVLGPVLLGAMADLWGYNPAFVMNAALMLLASLLFAAGARETAGRPRPAAG